MSKQKIPTGAVSGIYESSGRGFGFFTPDGGRRREDDWFIPPQHEGDAWHGDRVLALPDTWQEEGQRRTASVIRVQERANITVTGAVRRRGREVWLQPDNDRLPGPIRLLGASKHVRPGDKAAVRMLSYGRDGESPSALFRTVLGRDGTRQAAVEAILCTQAISRTFPGPVLKAAKAAPQAVEPSDLAGRLDLRDTLIFTIDGDESKDFDDAISLARRGDALELGVHIADVSRYVPEGSALDCEAWERGTSVYFADQVIPMLPEELSNGICSLNPGVDRLALSCFLTFAPSGERLDYRLARTVIRSQYRMTYRRCNAILEDGEEELCREYAELLPTLKEMAALAARLEKRRAQRGGLELESPEFTVTCDEDGLPVGVALRRQGTAERLIESFMLAANECVAEHLCRQEAPGVYRVHEKPTEEKRESLRTMLEPLGYAVTDMDHGTLQKLLKAAKGRPEEPVVNSLVLRSMMKARYAPENLGHFGLAAEFYCHFTSPIRRYPDLMVHRVLTAMLEGKLDDRTARRFRVAAAEGARQASQREIAAQTAERDIEKCYLAEFMQTHIGETFDATVSGVTRSGLFVTLECGIEGFLPVTALPDDRYDYDEGRMTLAGGAAGVRFCFGGRLAVVCAAADPAAGEITFALPEGTGGSAPAVPRERRERPLPRRQSGKKRGFRPPKRGKRGHRR